MSKWIWRFIAEKEAPWRLFITPKYGTEVGGWFTKEIRGSHGDSIWKEIQKEATNIKLNNSLVVGKGDKGRFWEDGWCKSLCVTCFPYFTLWLDRERQKLWRSGRILSKEESGILIKRSRLMIGRWKMLRA